MAAGASAVGRATPSAVGSSMLRPGSPDVAELGGDLAEPVERRAERLGGEVGVGVLGVLVDQPGDPLRRVLDTLGRVAQHVDGARRQVQPAGSGGHHGHPGAPLRQPDARDQPGQPGPDDHHPRHTGRSGMPTGRCSTSRVPWKIQSSRHAWRIWSP